MTLVHSLDSPLRPLVCVKCAHTHTHSPIARQVDQVPAVVDEEMVDEFGHAWTAAGSQELMGTQCTEFGSFPGSSIGAGACRGAEQVPGRRMSHPAWDWESHITGTDEGTMKLHREGPTWFLRHPCQLGIVRHAVDERRLAHIRPANDCKLRDALLWAIRDCSTAFHELRGGNLSVGWCWEVEEF